MGKYAIRFYNIEIEKHKFHCCKNPIFSNDVDTDNTLILNRVSPNKKTTNTFSVIQMNIKLTHSQ